MTLIGQNTYLIASVSSPPILTQQQSKPARLRHAESAGLPETCTPPSLPHGKAKGTGLKPQLWIARNKAGTMIERHQCCLSPYIDLGLAEQSIFSMCPHGTAVPGAVAGPAVSATSFISQTRHSGLLHRERSDRFPCPCRTKCWAGQRWW